ncbi:MAG: hypothetical protein IRZ13_16310 [Acetobacteraceae bacterium]|nr:hypothetical protein [Acetobacteraceae bacterium]
MPRRFVPRSSGRRLLLGAAAAAGASLVRSTRAAWPGRPVRIVVPFAAGEGSIRAR